ncbi:MAG: hypothetical protein ACE5G2_08240 [Candidatus Krumholzibacteriia bacterium]
MLETARSKIVLRNLNETYLGFTIQSWQNRYLATPSGWHGQLLEAPSLPKLRRQIWCWWYQVR